MSATWPTPFFNFIIVVSEAFLCGITNTKICEKVLPASPTRLRSKSDSFHPKRKESGPEMNDRNLVRAVRMAWYGVYRTSPLEVWSEGNKEVLRDPNVNMWQLGVVLLSLPAFRQVALLTVFR